VRPAILKNDVSVTTAIDEDMEFANNQEAYNFAVGSIDNLMCLTNRIVIIFIETIKNNKRISLKL